MANRHGVAAEDGETRLGSTRSPVQGALYIQSNGGADNPAVLLLDAVDSSGTVTTYGLWVDSTGDLRIAAMAANNIQDVITDEDGSGTVVGSQS